MAQMAPFVLVLSAVSAGLLIIANDIRFKIGLLGAQYLCVTLLVSLSIPLQVSLIKLLAGASVVTILLITVSQINWRAGEESNLILPSGRLFRMIAVLLVSTAAIGLGRSSLFGAATLNSAIIPSALLLGALGILQLGLRYRPIDTAIGLFTVLNGFEILYASLESSLAVLGLLAGVQVGIALAVSIVILDVDEPMGGERAR